MSAETNELLTALIARLPELEWKINGLGSSFSSKSLPKNLFRTPADSNAIAYVTEIKQDIHILSQQKHERSALYLAERITRKVNVLVALCYLHSRKPPPEEKTYFGIKSLSTRQQRLQELEKDIEALKQQQHAMIKTLEQMQRRRQDSAALLQLKSELGEIERRITLATETLSRATL